MATTISYEQAVAKVREGGSATLYIQVIDRIAEVPRDVLEAEMTIIRENHRQARREWLEGELRNLKNGQPAATAFTTAPGPKKNDTPAMSVLQRDRDPMAWRIKDGKDRPAKKKARKKARLSPKARAAKKTQGIYLGILKRLSGRDRKRIQKIARETGVAKAIAAGRKLSLRRSLTVTV